MSKDILKLCNQKHIMHTQLHIMHTNNDCDAQIWRWL